MRSFRHASVIAATLFAMLVAASPAVAQEAKTTAGYVVNFGIMPAGVALGVAGHRDAHPSHPPPGAQHLLITLDKEGKRVSEADVAIAVTDPRGHVEKKQLLHTQAGGLPDYSELFQFEWSGKYSVRVVITPTKGARPVETQFTVNHTV